MLIVKRSKSSLVDINQNLLGEKNLFLELIEEKTMPKFSFLNAAQLNDFKKLLKARYALLQNQETTEFANLIKNARNGIDEEREEFSAPDANLGAEQELTKQHATELREIEQAMLRIDQGIYGNCLDCESNIDFARLLAYPSAQRCLSCQLAFELAERRRI